MTTSGSGDLLRESSRSACGAGTTYCSESLKNDYDTSMRADACTVPTLIDFNSKTEDYVLWVPKYRRKTCEGSGYIKCSADRDRFGPQQVTQESFLQGRGQVTSNRNCNAGFVNYLPESQFPEKNESKLADMELFAQSTLVPRSCGTLSEVDMQARIDPLPGAWQGSWSPLANLQFADPNADPRLPNLASQARKTVSLGSKNKYPEWHEMKLCAAPYSR